MVTLTKGTLTVNKKAISYTIGNDSHDYGSTTTFSTLATSFMTGVNGQTLTIGSYASTGNTITANVGTYNIAGLVSDGTGLASNYMVALTKGTLTVTKKAISHTIGNDSHLYGSTANLATDLGSTFNTGVNGENLGIAYSSTGNTNTASVGNYDITGVVSDGTGLASNYVVALTKGTLMVNKAPLTIKADDKTIVLHAALPQFTVTPTGFVNGESFGVLGGTLTFTPTTTPANAGTYDIMPSGYTSNNYTITFQKGTLSVTYSASCIISGDPTHAILQPINPDGSSVSKAGSTVPAKFRVADANCNSIGTPGVVTSFYLLAQTADPNVTVNEDVVSTTPDTAFRWDPTAQQWIFNISTKGMKASQKYTYQITLNDGSTIKFSFALK
jgi:MBG domain (YGX type)